LGAGSLLALCVSPAAAKPCEKHQGDAKKACMKVKHERDARDKLQWPPKPSAAEIRKRVGDYNWNKARRVAICETGMQLDWYPTGRFRGPLGMYVTTQQYGMRATSYWSPTTWQEHVAIAVAAHPITGGWSGWGCGGA